MASLLGPLDTAIILTYLLLNLLSGALASRRMRRNMEGYFLGGRSLPWWALGLAGMANWFDLTGTMVITSFLYMLGPRGLYVEFRGGAVLVLVFMLAYTAKWHRRSGVMTGAEWMTYRFGSHGGGRMVRLITAAMGVICTLGALAYLVHGTVLFMGAITGWSPELATGMLLGVATLLIAWTGFQGVVMLNVFQGFFLLISCVLISILAYRHVPSAGAMSALAQSVTGCQDWSSSRLPWRTAMPPGYGAYEMLGVLTGFFLLRNILGGMGTGADARYFGARSDREAALQTAFQGVTIAPRWPFMMGIAVLGIFLVGHWFTSPVMAQDAAALIHQFSPQTGEAHWSSLMAKIAHEPGLFPAELIKGLQAILGDKWHQKLALVGYHGAVDPEKILPVVLVYGLPTGLRGLLIAAMLAATVSGLAGAVNSATGLLVRDGYQVLLRPKAQDGELIWISRLASVTLVATGFFLGLRAENLHHLWGWIVMGLGAGSVVPGILRLYWWRFNAWGVACSMVLGAATAVIQRLVWPECPQWLQFVSVFSLSLTAGVSASLLTAPTPSGVLEHFYRTTRPFGFWGPWRGILSAEDQAAMGREHRRDLWTIPFALLTQVCLFLLPMQLMIKAWGDLLVSLPLLLVGLAGLYGFWWRGLKVPRGAELVIDKG